MKKKETDQTMDEEAPSSLTTAPHSNDELLAERREGSEKKYRQKPPAFSTRMIHSAEKYTLILRICFISVLVAVAVVCGVVSYTFTKSLEKERAEENYEIVAATALEKASELTLRKKIGGMATASMLGYAFPDPEQWPYVFLDGYQDTVGFIGELSGSSFHTFTPIVYPDQIDAFHAHVEKHFGSHVDLPTNASDLRIFRFADYGRDFTPIPYEKVEDVLPGPKYTFAAPTLQTSETPLNMFFLFDTHSSPLSGVAEEAVLDCVRQHADLHDDCGVMTNIVKILVDARDNGGRLFISAIDYEAVHPANDRNQVVGFIGTELDFESVLRDVVLDDVNGLDCVISTETEIFTYTIVHGDPKLIGPGDYHDARFDHFGRSVVLNDFGADTSVKYTLTVYPTSVMLEEYETHAPRTVSIGIVAAIAFSAVFFLLYDFFMRGESRERRVVLETKRRFVRYISHEIRTPLQVVAMGLSLLRAELTSERKKDGENDKSTAVDSGDRLDSLLEIADEMAESTDAAVMILDNVLNYDKVEERGVFRIDAEKVDVLSLCQRTVFGFSSSAKKKQIALDFLICDQETTVQIESIRSQINVPSQESKSNHHCLVICDYQKLRQVICNLMSNALKFSPSNSTITVEISYNCEGLPNSIVPALNEDDGDLARRGSILIKVKDEGIGISPEDIPTVFHEGKQLCTDNLGDGGGSGLGLFISREIVDKHGGTLTAESSGRGMGSTFVVELPLFVQSEAASGSNGPGPAAQASDGVQLKGGDDFAGRMGVHCSPPNHHVLVVDDVLSNRKMTARTLERNGHLCKMVENGQEALDACQQLVGKEANAEFDTILMDFEMPLMNGPTATRLLRKAGCKALIIGVTGNVLPDDVSFFKSMGADHVLGKPIKIEQLDDIWNKH